jgi:hypothetical protein
LDQLARLYGAFRFPYRKYSAAAKPYRAEKTKVKPDTSFAEGSVYLLKVKLIAVAIFDRHAIHGPAVPASHPNCRDLAAVT